MDRAAKLAAAAAALLRDEQDFPGVPEDRNREITRYTLTEIVKSLGYSTELEISAAVDQALTDAGTTP